MKEDLMRRIFSAPAPMLALVATMAVQILSLQGQGVAYAQTRELATKGVLLDRVAPRAVPRDRALWQTVRGGRSQEPVGPESLVRFRGIAAFAGANSSGTVASGQEGTSD